MFCLESDFRLPYRVTPTAYSPSVMNFFGQNNPSNAGNAQPQPSNFLGINPTAGGSLFGNTNSQPSTGLPTGTASGSTSGTTGLFGNTSATNTPSGNQTTGTSSLFNLPKPAEQSSSQQPATSSFFGQPNATPGTSSPAPTNLFGPKPPTTSTTPTPNSSFPAPGAGLFGGGGFLGKPSTSTSGTSPTVTSAIPATTSATAASTAPAKDAPAISTGNLFGNFGAAPKPAETKSPASGGDFNLFGAAKAQEKKDELKSECVSNCFSHSPR
ncbi:hypothetical protein M378DRAFT_931731 [Amanita muscaria Koide BX008]|uniref:Uncharacterized protein n=1 Tax=Amanita muscaria (strain Koide BX008) TaxID=946122 RepID=A0A0C2XFA2_AMAMK|nr:hypothetical protein M378DRAFT_931731 [Amanita muscaria Koide BX008]